MKSKLKGFLELPYPKLMVNADKTLVVLFTQERTGTAVYSTIKAVEVGLYSEVWMMDTFSIFNGLIELKN